MIAEELDKIGINIDGDVVEEIILGKQEPIDRIFMRIERYIKIIAGANFLKFDSLTKEDFADDKREKRLVK